MLHFTVNRYHFLLNINQTSYNFSPEHCMLLCFAQIHFSCHFISYKYHFSHKWNHQIKLADTIKTQDGYIRWINRATYYFLLSEITLWKWKKIFRDELSERICMEWPIKARPLLSCFTVTNWKPTDGVKFLFLFYLLYICTS
jgi:hypothetical protein